jgi:hypothetical protein
MATYWKGENHGGKSATTSIRALIPYPDFICHSGDLHGKFRAQEGLPTAQ